uniref:Uncharacterized protein n=1 Tax=uncultured marine virus TaxID=186617 RepID=A0A0F7L385_9VIRU|nr:hypothetical protein [uncultured marine virus]
MEKSRREESLPTSSMSTKITSTTFPRLRTTCGRIPCLQRTRRFTTGITIYLFKRATFCSRRFRCAVPCAVNSSRS